MAPSNKSKKGSSNGESSSVNTGEHVSNQG